MKRLFTIILTLALLGAVCPAAGAETTYLFEAYGAKAYENDFDTATDADILKYPYFISGNAGITISETMARSGKSIAVAISDMETGEEENLLFSFHDSGLEPAKEYFYVEAYIKGFDKIPASMVPYYRYNGGSVPILDYGSEAAEDGWIRVWYVVPPLSDYVINGHVGWRYTRAMKDPDTIWIDDFSMRPLPTELVLQERSCTNQEPFDLSQIPAFGYSADGEYHEIENRHLMKWTVKKGNATVENGVLQFGTTQPQEILLEADFFGRTGEVVLFADAYAGTYPLGSAGEITAQLTKGTQRYCATLSNTGNPDTVYLVTATYRDGKLYKTAMQSVAVVAGATVVLECEIPVVPAMLGGEITSRAFVLSGANGTAVLAQE